MASAVSSFRMFAVALLAVTAVTGKAAVLLDEEDLDAILDSRVPAFFLVTGQNGVDVEALSAAWDNMASQMQVTGKGRAFVVRCADAGGVCEELESTRGEFLHNPNPMFTCWTGRKLAPYKGVKHLQDLHNWVTQIMEQGQQGGDAPGGGPRDVDETVPLMTIPEREILLDWIRKAPSTATFLEYGSGGSTVMVCDSLRGGQVWFSLEHNQEWFDKIEEELDEQECDFVELFLIQPVQVRGIDIDEEIFRPHGHPKEEMGIGLDDYIHAKTTLLDWASVTGVFVDGIARGPVLASLPSKLRPGTLVMLKHYKGRENWYNWALAGYEVVEQVDSSLILKVKAIEQPAALHQKKQEL